MRRYRVGGADIKSEVDVNDRVIVNVDVDMMGEEVKAVTVENRVVVAAMARILLIDIMMIVGCKFNRVVMSKREVHLLMMKSRRSLQPPRIGDRSTSL